jgi:serine/threonine protein kinase
MNIYLPGSRIADIYEVAGQPLAGGMGFVYPCFDHQFQRPVALKTFRPEFLPDRAARDRFLREGTLWINLGVHPHIVQAYGVERTSDGQEVYLVLELVAKIGTHSDASLRSWLIPGRPLPVEQALVFALQIARGMEHATSVIPGFVHRDLKPENVLVGVDMLPSAKVNRLRVTDFGLATVLQEMRGRVRIPARETQASAGDLRRTQLTQGFVGTPLYMAPEQWRGGPTDVRTDIYAVGCILYEILAGQQVVTGSSLAALGRAHCTGKLRPLPARLPRPVGKVVACCLARDTRRRYPDWAALEAALMSAYTEVTGKTAPGPEPPQALKQMEQVQIGFSYNALGASYMDIGKAEVALEYFARTWKIGHAEGERFLEAIALNHLGQTFLHLGNTQRAIGLHEQALEIAQEVSDHYLKEQALAGLGMAYARVGDNQHAVELYVQALAVAHEIGHRQGEGVVLGNLGTAYKNLGMYQQAIKFHEQALAIMRETGNRSQEGAGLNALGIIYKNLGDL